MSILRGRSLRNWHFKPVCLTQFPSLQLHTCGHDGEGANLTWYNIEADTEQRWVFRDRFVHADGHAMMSRWACDAAREHVRAG